MQLPEPEIIHAHVRAIFAIETLMLDEPARGEPYVTYTGRFLTDDTAAAYRQLEAALSPYPDRLIFFRNRPGGHLIYIIADPSLRPQPLKPTLNIVMFVATFLSLLLTGAMLSYEGDLPLDLLPMLATLLANLPSGFPFALSLSAILLSHEFGHYFASRRHKVEATLPYFIPAPFISPFGTLGAVILMRSVVKNRNALLDIAISGPLAGLIVTIPVLLLGLSLSAVQTVSPVEGSFIEGNSLVYLLAKFAIFGQLLPETTNWFTYFFTGQPYPAGALDVYLHPVALAGWAGLFVTGLNLIPLMQLDGGHMLYVLLGKRKTIVLPIILLALGLLGIFFTGWFLIILFVYFMIWADDRDPGLLDEVTPLSPARRWLAILGLILSVLLFMPVPMTLWMP